MSSVSLLARKPFNYPIAINVTVTKCTKIIHEDDYIFDIQLRSNITTWDIQPTLSQFLDLDYEIRNNISLQSVKIPKSITSYPTSSFMNNNGNKLITDYLWKLLRRAYIFISFPIQKFIQSPIIMENKINLLKKQLNTIIHSDNNIEYTINISKNIRDINVNNGIIDKKQINLVLRFGYILTGYHPNPDPDNDKDEEIEFLIDLVEVKRVLRYQQENRFEIETRKGEIYSFECNNQLQFDLWVNDIKNMIKAKGGYSPFLDKYDDNGGNEIEEKVVENIDNKNYLINKNNSISDEKHSENIGDGNITDPDVDPDADDDIDGGTGTGDDDDDDNQSVITDMTHDTDITDITDMTVTDYNDHNNTRHKPHHVVNNDDIMLKLEREKLQKDRRNAMIRKQKERMLRGSRDRNRKIKINAKKVNKLTLSSQQSGIIELKPEPLKFSLKPQAIMQPRIPSPITMPHPPIPQPVMIVPPPPPLPPPVVPPSKPMISLSLYNDLKDQLIKWQNKAQRWEEMAAKHEKNHERTELKLQQKELKYKKKIKQQQTEINKFKKLLKKKEYELRNNIIKMRQMESATNQTIQSLSHYKNTNEIRKKNSYIDGTLWKFIGENMHTIKYNKSPKLKYIMYIPTKKKLYYSESKDDQAKSTLINVTQVIHRNQDIVNSLPLKYKNKWIKIKGEKRLVLFAANSEQDADRWYTTIKNSL